MSEDPKTILVVDDDPDIVAASKLVLTTAGYQVETASDAEQALVILEKIVPDLMILDVMMSSVDEGFQLSYRIRGDERLSAIPILMCSSVSEQTGFSFNPETDGNWLPVNEFVPKPIDPPDLLARVQRLLKAE